MITDTKYNDIILYCKGWYYKNGNLLEDLGYLFSNIYYTKAKNEKTIALMMLNALDDIDAHSGRYRSLHSFLGEIERYKDLYDVSLDMAVIYFVKSAFVELSNKEIKLTAPRYGKKEYFRLSKNISMTYAEMNRIARKTFKD